MATCTDKQLTHPDLLFLASGGRSKENVLTERGFLPLLNIPGRLVYKSGTKRPSEKAILGKPLWKEILQFWGPWQHIGLVFLAS